MATNEKSSVIVELYDLPLTKRKDDRFGRVVTTRSLSEDDLIAMAVSQRTDLNPATLKSSIDILKRIAVDQIVNGASVCLGLGYFNLSVNGVFIGDNAIWDSSMHRLLVRLTPTAELLSALKDTRVNVRGLAASGPVVNTVTNVTSGEINSRLTPGGGVSVSGNKLKIDGSHTSIGIYLTNQATSDVIAIPKTSILMNNPRNIMFIAPNSLVNGDYKLSITTQFCNSTTLLKEPRSYCFDYVLNVSI